MLTLDQSALEMSRWFKVDESFSCLSTEPSDQAQPNILLPSKEAQTLKTVFISILSNISPYHLKLHNLTDNRRQLEGLVLPHQPELARGVLPHLPLLVHTEVVFTILLPLHPAVKIVNRTGLR